MKKSFSSRRAAFSLVEVTLALGVAAFCFVVIFGLLPTGLNTSQAASEQSAATAVVNTVVSDLRCTPPAPTGTTTVMASPLLGLKVPDANSVQVRFFDANGRIVNDLKTAPADFLPRYRLRVSFPANAGGRTATYALVQVTWPAPATPFGLPTDQPSTVTDESKVSGLLESFIALDRN